MSAATMAPTPGGGAQPSDVQMENSADQCLEQLRAGASEWIECRAAFASDAAGRAELSKRTFDIVRDAKCGGNVRVQRAALVRTRKDDGVLDLDPQNVLCNVTTNLGTIPNVNITLSPQITFQGGRVVDVSPRITNIANLPDFFAAPLGSAVESTSIRKQLAKGLDAFLEEAFAK